MRWLVSVLPATTALGWRAFSRQPSGARTSTAPNSPSFTGTSAPSATLTAKMHAARVTASGAFTLPGAASEVPAKSITM